MTLKKLPPLRRSSFAQSPPWCSYTRKNFGYSSEPHIIKLFTQLLRNVECALLWEQKVGWVFGFVPLNGNLLWFPCATHIISQLGKGMRFTVKYFGWVIRKLGDYDEESRIAFCLHPSKGEMGCVYRASSWLLIGLVRHCVSENEYVWNGHNFPFWDINHHSERRTRGLK